MARIFVTGSSDGLGAMAARRYIEDGHKVTLHARNEQRASDAKANCPGSEGVLIGDLSSMKQTKKLAGDANASGTFDVVVHNAGIYQGGFRRTSEGFPSLIAVNVLAPYILTCLMHKPSRLVFLSSDSHYSGDASKESIDDLGWQKRSEGRWSDSRGYGDSKLYNNLLANAFARRWPDVLSNSFHPGWIATKMGGRMAPGDIGESMETYALLAEGTGNGNVTGKFFYPGGKERSPQSAAHDVDAQEHLMKACEKITGVTPPAWPA